MSLVRTIRFVGSAYGTEDVNLTATLNGVTIFNGNVLTKPPANVSVLPEDQYTLFSTEIPMFNYGELPTSITVNSGDFVIFGLTQTNYAKIPGPGNTVISSGAEQFVPSFSGPDTKLNVKIDDIAQETPDPRPPEALGSWTWTVPVNSTISFSSVISQGDAGPNPA